MEDKTKHGISQLRQSPLLSKFASMRLLFLIFKSNIPIARQTVDEIKENAKMLLKAIPIKRFHILNARLV